MLVDIEPEYNDFIRNSWRKFSTPTKNILKFHQRPNQAHWIPSSYNSPAVAQQLHAFGFRRMKHPHLVEISCNEYAKNFNLAHDQLPIAPYYILSLSADTRPLGSNRHGC